MSLLAIGFVVWPLLHDLPRQYLPAGFSILVVTAGSAAIYGFEGSPNVPSGASEQPDIGAMVASLSQRLEERPDDIDGWKMLGRSRMTLGDYSAAAAAYDRAVQLESASNAQTLVSLGEALLAESDQRMTDRTISLFENALALEPGNSSALFWGGIAAFNRGNNDLAADRWELLLGTNPPEEVRSVLQQRIAAWRGGPPKLAAPGGAGGIIISASINVSADAVASLPIEATVFVIARDPAQPSPPIAVTRRLLSELPAMIELGDKDSMLPGRQLSAFEEFELLVRVSVSGNPAAAKGDWFGSSLVRPADESEASITIDEQVQ